MNRGDQGPFLLAVAGTLLLLAVVAYAISDADDIAERREALARSREVFREQTEQLAVDRKALSAEMDRINKASSAFSSQQNALMKVLKRLERTELSSSASGNDDQ